MPNPTQHPHQPRTQKDLVLGLDRLPLPMPRTTRELFELFALARPGDLPGLLDRLDFSGVIPHQVYQLVHERAPERLDLFVRPDGYDARKHMEAALLSAEFQEKVLQHLLNAFPEKSRNVFIHVPKCAGTDLILNVGARQLSLSKMLEEEGWISKQQLFEALRNLVQAIPYHDDATLWGLAGRAVGYLVSLAPQHERPLAVPRRPRRHDPHRFIRSHQPGSEGF